MTTSYMLPDDVTQGASLRGNEYGWNPSEFPRALARAEAQGLACLGGQFQFRFPDGSTYEMYWLSADSAQRCPDETWPDYVRRSCSEVVGKFGQLLANSDFKGEAAKWPWLRDDVEARLPDVLVFVAYFITESEYANLRK